MPLTSRTPTFIVNDLPNDPGAWVECRRLSANAVRKARAAASAEAVRNLRDLGGDLVGAMAKVNNAVAEASPEEIAAARTAVETDPLRQMDVPTVLYLGIVDWSFIDDHGHAIPHTIEEIDDLDEETQLHLARAIVRPPRTEADRKNVSVVSTTTSTATEPHSHLMS